MEKKKILMVHNFYQIGGGEHTVFRNEVNLLKKNGHEVVEYTRDNSELKASKWKLFLMPFTTVWSFKTYREVRRLIKNQNIDIVHCHNTFPLISPSVYYASRSLGKPVIQTIHNFRFLCPAGIFFRDGKICEKCREKNNFQEAIKNNCYRNSKLQTLILVAMLTFHRKIGTYKKISYIFLTNFNRKKFDKLIDINSDQVFLKPNFVLKTKESLSDKKEKVFVFASRLDANKGINYLVDYWKKLPQDYILHIYGEGSLSVHVEKNTQSNIVYYGFKAQNDIYEDMSKAVAMVFPSMLYEGYSMIVAESMAMGCPVLSTNIGNSGDIISESKGGVIFDPTDEESFKKALEEILINNKQYSEAALNYYKMNLSEKENYRRLIEIYDKTRVII